MHFLCSNPRDREKPINLQSCWDARLNVGLSNSEEYKVCFMDFELAKTLLLLNSTERSFGVPFFVVAGFMVASETGGAIGQYNCRAVRVDSR
jgi:hypothetical protein